MPIKKLVSEEPANKKYTDPELFQALEEDGIRVTEQDIQKARVNDTVTLYKIGDIYYKNEDYEKAFPWFYKAALLGHIDSQAQVGWMYEEGEGVPMDIKQAVDWSMKAASTDNAKGQYNIGYLYYYGDGVPQDYKQAIFWYLQAANNGSSDAMNDIGRMYQDGEGVTNSIPSAIEWFSKAANQGNKYAQYNLGIIYQFEDGYKDLQKAVDWYQKAINNGDEISKQKMEELNRQGYYAKKEKQEDETIQGDAITSANNVQIQSSIITNDDHFSKLIDDKMKSMEESFELKMRSMEQRYAMDINALQKELVSLKQEKHQQYEEIKRLRDKLASLEASLDDNNDIYYD